jgi:hypothetical protein
MKPLLIAISAAAIGTPVAVATPAIAQSREYRQELRESARSGIWIVRPCLVSIYNFFIHPIKYLNT